MARYKIRWNDLTDVYDVYDFQSREDNPSADPVIVGKITPRALSTLVSKLMLHSSKTNVTLSDSFMQLSDELAADFQEYVAVLSSHRTKELDKVQESIAEFKDVTADVVSKFSGMMGELAATVESVTDSLPKAIYRDPKTEQTF